MPSKAIPNTTKKTPKKGKQKEVVYDILLECSALMRDEFWKQFYEDLAIGKSTKGIYITNGIIQTSNKRNGFVYSITDKAPEVIVAELHHLITTHTSICSRKDMNKKRQFIKEIEDELLEYDQAKWTGIKRKNIRNMLLVDYAIHLNKVHSLSWPATIAAYQTIINAFESKTHSSKDVLYSDGKVRGVIDIEISDDETTIINTRYDQQATNDHVPEEPEGKAIMLQSLFEPYMSALVKMIKA